MARIRILTTVFHRGEVQFKAGTVVEVEQPEADKLVRRGVAVTEAAVEATVEAPTKKKGK